MATDMIARLERLRQKLASITDPNDRADLAAAIAALEQQAASSHTLECHSVDSADTVNMALLFPLYETAMDALVSIDERQIIIGFNPAAEDIFGWSAGEIMGQPLALLLPEPFRVQHADHVRAFGESGATSRRMGALNALTARRKDGTTFPIEASISQIQRNGSTLFTAIIRDMTERVRVEQALRESEERFRATFDQAAVGMSHVGLSGQWLRVNQRLCDIVGYTRAELLTRTFQDLTHPDDLAADLALVQQVLANELQIYRMEKRYIHKNGMLIWINLTVSLQRDAAGEPLYFIGVVEDITARKQIEHALHASEVRFAKAFHSSPAAIGITRLADGQLLDINEAFTALTGYQHDEAVGRTTVALGLFTAEQRAQMIQRLQQDGLLRNVELTFVNKFGMSRTVLFSMERVELAEGACLLSILYNITDRKAAEIALRESEQRLQAILDRAPILIMLKDVARRIYYINDRAATALQCAPHEVIGRTVAEVFSADIAAAIETNEQMVLEQGQPREIEAIIPTPAGLRTYSVLTFPLRDQQRGIYALCIMAVDTTERKHLEAQLLQSQKMESIGQLAGGIAHDFNNLLTVILSYAEFARESLPADHSAVADLREVQHTAKRASTLIQQLLTFARRQPMHATEITLNDVVAGMDPLLRRLLPENITVLTHLDPNLLHITGDAGKIEQVLLNLIVNARDAMPDGGKLIIETTNVMLDAAYACTHLHVAPGTYVMLAVSDTGIGMPPDVQSRIFEPFFTTKEIGKGTGLGLSTCYGIVQQHGGTIGVYSEVNGGTTMKVYLPPAAAANLVETPAALDTALPHGNETVLVVEDEASVRALAVRVLQTCGYTVLEAANGAEALTIAQNYRPAPIHLLLSDMVMPQLSGPAIADLVTTLYPAITVLYISGYTAHASLQYRSATLEGTFLQKPFTPAALAQAVRAALDSDSPLR